MRFDVAQEKAEEGLEIFAKEFLSDRKKEFLSLLESLKSDEFETIRATSHRWKGFCGPYGFCGLMVLAQELEECCVLGDRDLVKKKLEEVESYLKEKQKYT